jgi:hypothetical protein
LRWRWASSRKRARPWCDGWPDAAEKFRKGRIALATTPRRRLKCAFCRRKEDAMEAERLNAIANRLADLKQRETDLRRYL